MPITAFCDATILTGEAVVENHALLVHGPTIIDIVQPRAIPSDAQKMHCAEQIIAPGLIDVQVNGGGNILLNNQPTPEACLAIAKAHRMHGTTSLLLTCISDTPEITRQAAAAVRAACHEDHGILGIHFEGPHLSTDKRGVHSPYALRSPRDVDIDLYQRHADEIVLVTLAPEMVSPALIKTLAEKAVISLGHTSAPPEQIRAALKAGARGFTHLYNAMDGMSARAPGVIGIALDDANSWCSLIADDFHVMPEMIRLALRSKPTGKVFLTSDAMAPAGTDKPQNFKLYGQDIHVGKGRCTTAEGKLAGSAITLLDAVRYCVRKVGVELDEALRMASTYPAAFLGIGHKLGRLLPNHTADLIVLDQKLELQKVYSASHAST